MNQSNTKHLLNQSAEAQLEREGAVVVAIAKAAGFAITTEGLQANQQNLTDQELEGAAGGGACRRDPSVGNRLRCDDLWSKVA
ncbi:Nif11-like leader peptide family RiPP precursor [Prochlorococcus marinus]|uniref:Nif11-like leader peptide family RiPP precursor n=1 Tax=Prochlorococcus marinus TaxID=1219 RepID=UPI001F44BB39|nr:Nif11-like leader peptide family RiPP precursor [Prochlorococcus marinus]